MPYHSTIMVASCPQSSTACTPVFRLHACALRAADGLVRLLPCAGLQHLSAVPIRVGDKVVGVLCVGFEDPTGEHADTVM